jgi:Transposase DDE domain group 1
MRQEVDIRYVVTSLEGSAQHLYENVYCQRGQMENLIKLHKAQGPPSRQRRRPASPLLG